MKIHARKFCVYRHVFFLHMCVALVFLSIRGVLYCHIEYHHDFCMTWMAFYVSASTVCFYVYTSAPCDCNNIVDSIFITVLVNVCIFIYIYIYIYIYIFNPLSTQVYIGPGKYFVTSDVGRGRTQWYAFLALPEGTKSRASNQEYLKVSHSVTYCKKNYHAAGVPHGFVSGLFPCFYPCMCMFMRMCTTFCKSSHIWSTYFLAGQDHLLLLLTPSVHCAYVLCVPLAYTSCMLVHVKKILRDEFIFLLALLASRIFSPMARKAAGLTRCSRSEPYVLVAFFIDCIHTYVRTYVHTYIHTHVTTYVCLCVCVYICICIYTYIYIYIYMDTLVTRGCTQGLGLNHLPAS
jgi:hypothetical protein